jgi:hypothetical protein
MKRLILHVGVPKTGTSLIQRTMRQLRPELRRSGVVYIDRKAMHRLPDRPSWSAYGTGPEENRPRFLADLREVVKRERLQTAPRARTVVMSNESMIGRVAPEYGDPFWPRATDALTDVVSALEPKSTRVIMYIRRQDRLLESLFMQRIHLGATMAWNRFHEAACRDDRIRYQDLIQAIETVPTVEEISVAPFELIGAGGVPFVTHFLRSLNLGLERLVADREDEKPSNPSYTQPAYELALKINKHLETPAQRELTRKYLRQLFPADEYPKAQLLTDDQRNELIEVYRPTNEKFFAEYLPEFPVDSYSSPEATGRLGAWLR